MRRLIAAGTRPRVVGLLGIVALAVGALVVVGVTALPLGARTYSAMLAQTAGLRTGESVQVAGVDVGEVRGIHLDGRQVRVTFTVKRSVHLGRDTRASVEVATLLGTHLLAVKPRGSGDVDTIPLAHTSVPYNLQDVITGSQHTLSSLDSASLATSLSTVADALQGTSASSRAALDGVSRLSAVAAKRADQMRALLTATRSVTSDLAANTGKFRQLLKDSTLVLEELTARRDVIHQMLIDARELAHQVSGMLKDTGADLDPLMKNLTTALDHLNEQKTKINASINGLAQMSHYFADATGNGPWIDMHIASLAPDSMLCVISPGPCR